MAHLLNQRPGKGAVLLVSPSAVPGGAERALVGLARHLPAFGYEPKPVLLHRGPVEEWFAEVGWPAHVVEAGRLRDPAAGIRVVRELRSMIRRTGIQAVVSNMAKGHVYGGAACWASSVPAIWWQQGIPDAASRMDAVAARVPATVVVASCEEAVAAQRELTPERRVVKIHLGSPVEQVAEYRGSGQAIRAQLGWESAPVVGIVGRLQAWKGQRVFLEAAARVARANPAARFLVVGGAVLGWEGDYPAQLQTQVEELGITDRVHFAGHRSDVYPWFDAMDVVVHASFGEPFGLVLVEALALGKPLVATAAGGPLEIIEDGVSGVLVPVGEPAPMADAILSIVGDEARAAALRAGALARAPRFSEERMAAGFAELLTSLDIPGRGRRLRRHPPDATPGPTGPPPPAADPAARPRVALVAHRVDHRGGMERACAELIQHTYREFRFHVVSGYLEPELIPLVEGWTRIPIPARPFAVRFGWFLARASVALRRVDADVVHTVGAIVVNRVDVAAVHYCHAGAQAAQRDLPPERGIPLLRRANKAVSKAIARGSERLCYRPGRLGWLAPVSLGVATELARWFPGVAIATCPNGVDAQVFRPDRAARARMRAQAGVPEDALVALFVGGDWDRKGLPILIHALERVREQGCPYRLWVVGGGEPRRMQGIAEACGVAPDVTFFGPSEVPEVFYQAADVFVLPSAYETFSLASFEAAACGLPVIATRVSGVCELVGNGEAGILVDRDPATVAAALARLGGNASLRHHLGTAARVRAAGYTWEASADSYARLYRAVLERRTAATRTEASGPRLPAAREGAGSWH
ncbi:MAG TPA: glycosyltransferase [Actinomycetota bacterium]|nr:glycosyltransferase [Actinomycetota bacterium]